MGKKPGSGSGTNNPDDIFESLETIFWVKKFFDDPGWKKFGSGINIPDPQHWCCGCRSGRIQNYSIWPGRIR
jgi:hypothetical protein